jgi:hypothetical protein
LRRFLKTVINEVELVMAAYAMAAKNAAQQDLGRLRRLFPASQAEPRHNPRTSRTDSGQIPDKSRADPG